MQSPSVLYAAVATGAFYILCAVAHAQAGEPYVGIAAGGSGADFEAASTVYPSTLGRGTTQRRDRNDKAARIFGGYSFSPYIAAEISAGIVGQFDVTERSGSQSLRNELSVGAIAIDAVATWPVSRRLGIYAGAGAAYARVKSSVTLSGGAQLAPGTKLKRTDSRTIPHARIGVAWQPANRWHVRFETDAYFDAGVGQGPNATGTSNLNTLAVGVAYRF